MSFKYPSHIQPTIEIDRALESIVNGNRNVFLTGRAGTGKSTILQIARNSLSERNVAVLAPTGLAAINVGGQTIHSFFMLPPKLLTDDDIKWDRKKMALVRNLDILIIDEVSMIRADIMHTIDTYCRRSRNANNIAFGGLRVILIGDTAQLPPVVKDYAEECYLHDNFGGAYFFNTDAYKSGNFEVIELNEVHRQKDVEFLDSLNAIRIGEVTDQHLDVLNARVTPFSAGITETHVVLVPTNALAEKINTHCLSRLPGDIEIYQAKVEGDYKPADYPTDSLLELKPGAKVVMLENDPGGRWVNGTRCEVAEITPDAVSIKLNGSIYPVRRKTWERLKYEYSSRKLTSKTVGKFIQFPMRLAWAMTIHKSQGMTLRAVYLNLGRGTFAHGQTYVALSRCSSLDGLALARAITSDDIIFEPECFDFRSHETFSPF